MPIEQPLTATLVSAWAVHVHFQAILTACGLDPPIGILGGPQLRSGGAGVGGWNDCWPVDLDEKVGKMIKLAVGPRGEGKFDPNMLKASPFSEASESGTLPCLGLSTAVRMSGFVADIQNGGWVICQCSPCPPPHPPPYSGVGVSRPFS